jgi:hypothetical protein
MSIAEDYTPPHRIARGTRRARRRRPVTIYDPKLLGIMQRAFEAACSQLPVELTGTDMGRQNLARRVLVYVDRGERDPRQLAYLAGEDVRDVERAERRKSSALREETYAAG